MNLLRNFFHEEKKRVFLPPPFFTQRILARLNARRLMTESGIWELLPTCARSVFALALMLVVCFLALEMFIPRIPERGLLEAYLEPEESAAESVLYSESEVPAGQDFFELIALEEQR